MSRSRETEGFSSLLVVALVILAALLFAAGVVVGRNLAGQPCPNDRQQPPAVATPKPPALSFPEALEKKSKPLPRPPVTGGDGNKTAGTPGHQQPASPDQREGHPDAGVASGTPAAPGGNFCLQVAAYCQIEPARQLAAKLRAKGYSPVKLVKSDVAGKGTYFRVRLGNFTTRQQAQQLQRRLAVEDAMDSLVVRVE